jgi:hypothetical protein
MTMKQVILTFLCLFFAAPALAQAGDPAAFQFAMPGLRAPDNPSVSGFRLSFLQGKNVNMSGLDFGLLSMSETENRSGLSLIFGVSKTTGRSTGCNGGLIVTHDGEANGLNAAFINRVRTMKSGANLGFINITDGFSSVDISGVGISNRSNVQLGFVNITKTIDSFQFGFLNIAENGFLPVFPIFNFPKN